MGIFFTSDLHIGHNKDFIWQARGFNSIEEHDTTILKNWNSIITPDDTVFILGDLCMSGNEYEWNRIYKCLNGHIKFVHGNHDTDKKILRYTEDYNMEDLGYGFIYRIAKKKKFLLTHYPTIVTNINEENKFFVNLCGHSHTQNKFIDMDKGAIYHVELDAHNCMPVSLEQIIRDIEKFKGEKF